MPAGLVVAEAVRVVVADIDAGGEIGGKPDKPGIMEVVVVPVLPAMGLPTARTAVPVPRCTTP
jgi:hypothetical protein